MFLKNSIPPSLILNEASGTIRSSSGSNVTPSPLQLGQQPNGELNENNLGSISGTVNPHLGHECVSEYNVSFSFTKTKTLFVLEFLSAVSTASLILVLVSVSL